MGLLQRSYSFDEVPVILVPPAPYRRASVIEGTIHGFWTARLSRTMELRVSEVDAYLHIPSLAGVLPFAPDRKGGAQIPDVSAVIPIEQASFRVPNEVAQIFGPLNRGRISSKTRIVTATLGVTADFSHVVGLPREKAHIALKVLGVLDGPETLTMVGSGIVVTGLLRLTILACAGPRRLRPEAEPTRPRPPVPPPEPPLPPTSPPDPCTNVPVPDTDATINDALVRIGRDTIHTNNRAGLGSQGDWARVRLKVGGSVLQGYYGQTWIFIKLQLGVGCTQPNDWKIGIRDIDLQFRVALSPDAQNRQAADGGTTPGGFAGVLGHEAEHGETAAYALHHILDGTYSTAGRFSNLVDGMRRRVYRTRAEAERAAADFQRRMLDFLKEQISGLAAKHNDNNNAAPNETVYPRLETAEPLDNESQRNVEDRKTLEELQDQMRQLKSSAYEMMGPQLDGLPP